MKSLLEFSIEDDNQLKQNSYLLSIDLPINTELSTPVGGYINLLHLIIHEGSILYYKKLVRSNLFSSPSLEVVPEEIRGLIIERLFKNGDKLYCMLRAGIVCFGGFKFNYVYKCYQPVKNNQSYPRISQNLQTS